MQERREGQPGAWDHTGQHCTALMERQQCSASKPCPGEHKFQWVFVSSWLLLPFIPGQSCALASEVQLSEQSSLGTHSHCLNRAPKQWVGNHPAKCALGVMQSSWFVFFLVTALRKNIPCFSQLLLRPRRNLNPTFTGSPHSAGLGKHGWGRSGSQDTGKELWSSAHQSPPGWAGSCLPGYQKATAVEKNFSVLS